MAFLSQSTNYSVHSQGTAKSSFLPYACSLVGLPDVCWKFDGDQVITRTGFQLHVQEPPSYCSSVRCFVSLLLTPRQSRILNYSWHPVVPRIPKTIMYREFPSLPRRSGAPDPGEPGSIVSALWQLTHYKQLTYEYPWCHPLTSPSQ